MFFWGGGEVYIYCVLFLAPLKQTEVAFDGSRLAPGLVGR